MNNVKIKLYKYILFLIFYFSLIKFNNKLFLITYYLMVKYVVCKEKHTLTEINYLCTNVLSSYSKNMTTIFN